jgi:hypothetical protein
MSVCSCKCTCKRKPHLSTRSAYNAVELVAAWRSQVRGQALSRFTVAHTREIPPHHCWPACWQRCATWTRRTSGSAAGRAPLGQAVKRAQRTACGSAHSAASTRGCARPNWLAPEARPDLDFGAGAALLGPRVVVWRASSSAQAAEGVPASTRAPLAGVTLRVACDMVLPQCWLPCAAQLSQRLASSALAASVGCQSAGMQAVAPKQPWARLLQSVHVLGASYWHGMSTPHATLCALQSADKDARASLSRYRRGCGRPAPEARPRAVRRGEHLAEVRHLAAAGGGCRSQALGRIAGRPQAALRVEARVQELDAPQRQHCAP